MVMKHGRRTPQTLEHIRADAWKGAPPGQPQLDGKGRDRSGITRAMLYRANCRFAAGFQPAPRAGITFAYLFSELEDDN